MAVKSYLVHFCTKSKCYISAKNEEDIMDELYDNFEELVNIDDLKDDLEILSVEEEDEC